MVTLFELDGLAGLAALDAALDKAGTADAEVRGTAESILASQGAVGLTDVPLNGVLYVAGLALALVVSQTNAIETGNVALWLALGGLAIPLEAGGALAHIRADAASVLAGSG